MLAAPPPLAPSMCLISFAWRCHPRYELALIANRDEFHARPAAAAAPWDEAPHLLGGRDLEKGGSWLLLSAQGRFAAVTNVRVGGQPETGRRSRGALVMACAQATRPADAVVAALAADAAGFGRFNLLHGDGDTLFYAGNHPQFRARAVAPGLHALSNGDFDAAWPKARHAQSALVDWLHTEAMDTADPDLEPLFAALADTREAEDAELPDTGVGLALERRLSAAFIVGSDYGTRASTVLLIGGGQAQLIERRFGPHGVPLGESHHRLPWSD